MKLYATKIDRSWMPLSGLYDDQREDYFYKNLEQVREAVLLEAELSSQQQVEFSTPVIVIDQIFQANIQAINSYLSELQYRHLWDKKVKSIRFNANRVNRVGTEHNCVLSLGNLKFKTITAPTETDLVYGEKTEEMLFCKNYSYLVRLRKINENSTQVTLTIYLDFTTIGKFMKSRILKMLKNSWEENLVALHHLSKNKIQ
ncbi:hypothetical protein [Flavobacterium sp. 14A]|uniref:hypothetical protein n=1 Tax=Flavobacterium sp. 14A TaxID=2735896 RepID=UPI001570E1DF|nr:hypothetical protein [Flavobacterium sp. 14A]NRT12707.1 hypothetical protein [Flavobacterium sp. 14A]